MSECRAEFNINLRCNFLTYNTRDRNIMIGQRNIEVCINLKSIIFHSKPSLDDPGLFLTVDVELALCPDGVHAIARIIYLFNDLTAKRSLGVPGALHVVIIEVLPLQVGVETPERSYCYREGELVRGRVDDALSLSRGRFDQLELGIRH
jgi:hypothetical protein